MSDLKTEIQYDLENKFMYSSKGEQVEAQFITLTAPTSKHSHECAALKQAFFRALPRDQESDENVEAKDVSGTEVIILLAISTNVELPDVIEIGKKLLSSGVAMIDGEVKLTMNVINNMYASEFEIILGDYIVNFIIASSLASMKNK